MAILIIRVQEDSNLMHGGKEAWDRGYEAARIHRHTTVRASVNSPRTRTQMKSQTIGSNLRIEKARSTVDESCLQTFDSSKHVYSEKRRH